MCVVFPPGAAHASRARILYREPSFFETGQLGDRAGPDDDDSGGADGLRVDASRLQVLKKGVALDRPPVDAQRERRARVPGIENLRGAVRILGTHPVDPPPWV